MAVTRTVTAVPLKSLLPENSASTGLTGSTTEPVQRSGPHFPAVHDDTTRQAPRVAFPLAPFHTGLGSVAQNDEVLQRIAERMAPPRNLAPGPTGILGLAPAWTVDYFRWPRLVKHLLAAHGQVFQGLGNYVLERTQPTRRRIGICSTFSREGKTTVSICLARWAALAGHRTVLIDADIEKPFMTRCSGLESVEGWQELSQPGKCLNEVMVRSMDSGLVFIPSVLGDSSSCGQKLLDQLSVVSFQLKYEFDLVFIDLGTIDSICCHANGNSDLVDFMVVVRDPARTSTGQLIDTRKVLDNLGLRQHVVAENLARGTGPSSK